jgi:hypothetical protein
MKHSITSLNGSLRVFFLNLLQAWILGSFLLVTYRRFNPSTLLFDQFVTATGAVFLLSIALLYNKRFGFKNEWNTFTRLMTSMCVALLFFSTVQYSVLAVDRSRSLYIFSWVDTKKISWQSEQKSVAIQNNLYSEKVEIEALTQRVNEQVARGLMKIEKNQIKLTVVGKFMLQFSKMFAVVFNLKGWYENI